MRAAAGDNATPAAGRQPRRGAAAWGCCIASSPWPCSGITAAAQRQLRRPKRPQKRAAARHRPSPAGPSPAPPHRPGSPRCWCSPPSPRTAAGRGWPAGGRAARFRRSKALPACTNTWCQRSGGAGGPPGRLISPAPAAAAGGERRSGSCAAGRERQWAPGARCRRWWSASCLVTGRVVGRLEGDGGRASGRAVLLAGCCCAWQGARMRGNLGPPRAGTAPEGATRRRAPAGVPQAAAAHRRRRPPPSARVPPTPQKHLPFPVRIPRRALLASVLLSLPYLMHRASFHVRLVPAAAGQPCVGRSGGICLASTVHVIIDSSHCKRSLQQHWLSAAQHADQWCTWHACHSSSAAAAACFPAAPCAACRSCIAMGEAAARGSAAAVVSQHAASHSPRGRCTRTPCTAAPCKCQIVTLGSGGGLCLQAPLSS